MVMYKVVMEYFKPLHVYLTKYVKNQCSDISHVDYKSMKLQFFLKMERCSKKG